MPLVLSLLEFYSKHNPSALSLEETAKKELNACLLVPSFALNPRVHLLSAIPAKLYISDPKYWGLILCKYITVSNALALSRVIFRVIELVYFIII